MKSNFIACLALAACSLEALSVELQPGVKGRLQDRHKRTLVFTSDSATGILFALSVPLLIPDRNIFLAYNFEANYGMPGKASDFTQGVLKKVDNDQIHPEEGEAAEDKRSIRTTAAATTATAGFTRKKVYRMIELNLNRHGYDGKKCILRMICELAKHPVRDGNGIVGDLLQLVFTPSESYNEGLPGEFYHAEKSGKRENCAKYSRYCPKDPLETISLIL
ncbi:AGAP004006-PA [Anopheles gambiae str. PEST]|uniref:AGAP004006-PA n=1 Tax=Anopheles gambiae TaxID=7165 RepID=A7UV00_ANOGA|nr:AGAP004006-PA [Anopheles gambiae str. PEST]